MKKKIQMSLFEPEIFTWYSQVHSVQALVSLVTVTCEWSCWDTEGWWSPSSTQLRSCVFSSWNWILVSHSINRIYQWWTCYCLYRQILVVTRKHPGKGVGFGIDEKHESELHINILIFSKILNFSFLNFLHCDIEKMYYYQCAPLTLVTQCWGLRGKETFHRAHSLSW